MSFDEPPPPSSRQPRTIGFVVAVGLVLLLLGVRAWLGWWQHLP
jgi:hypothetical protein